MTAVLRLDVNLPPFRRTSWATSAARDLWGGRIDALQQVWVDVLLGTRGGPAPAIPVTVGPELSHKLRSVAARAGRRLVPVPEAVDGLLLPWRIGSYTTGAPTRRSFLLARPGVLETLARRDLDLVDQARALAVPACCAAAVAGRVSWCDPWWPTAEATAGESGDDAVRELPAGSSRTLLRHALGLPSLWFVPCTMVCPEALGLEQQLLERLSEVSRVDLGWLGELDAWPVEWSSLHGIAEIKTSVGKVMTDTDAVARPLVVRIPGVDAVPGSARGVRFPYRPSPRVRRQLRLV